MLFSSLHYVVFPSFYFFQKVEYVESAIAFYLWHHGFEKKLPMEKESSHAMGGTSTFIALFPHIYDVTKRKLW